MKKTYIQPAQQIVEVVASLSLLAGSMRTSGDVELGWGGEGNPEEDGI